MADIREHYILGKHRDREACGDAIYIGENFLAIIDGNTPKGKRLWGGLEGDVFVAKLLGEALPEAPADACAEELIGYLNNCIRDCYGERLESIPPEEQLAASVIVYSISRREIWCFGDCQCLINDRLFNNVKRVDILLSEARSLYIQTELASGKTLCDIAEHDTGREAILPFLKRQALLANREGDFGYDVLNGGEIRLERIKKYNICAGDFVVLASDGYPVLRNTLAESEERLLSLLASDPLCINENKSTKGYNPRLNSYDDRSYLSFVAE